MTQLYPKLSYQQRGPLRRKGGMHMKKEQLLAALEKAGEGANLSVEFWDEFVTISALVHDATDEQVAQAWSSVHHDD